MSRKISRLTDGGPISCDEDGLGEVQEGVKHSLVVDPDQVVELPDQEDHKSGPIRDQ